MAVATDKWGIASASVARAETHDLDIAIIKSTTSQFHVVPKEKHVQKLVNAIHVVRSRQDVVHVKTELLKRLRKASDWLTALKTLMVIHRLMRESNDHWLLELMKVDMASLAGGGNTSTPPRRGSNQRVQVLNMDNFIDTTNIEGRFEFSQFVRAYGKYLDEQLEVYNAIQWYQEQEHAGEQSRMRALTTELLLQQLPMLQRLMNRLIDCRPTGAASQDHVVQAALFYVLKESFKVYKAISEGLINLADKFFDMDYFNAQKALDIYKESIQSAERLQAMYRDCEGLDEIKRVINFPKLEMPPADFLQNMEDYAKQAPRQFDDSGPKKKSPPLRKGKFANPRGQGEAPGSGTPPRLSDPGMVIAFDSKGLEHPSKPQQLDLLNFEDLSIDPASSTPASSSAPTTEPARQSQPVDYLSSLSETNFGPESTASADPFGPSTFGSTDSGAHSAVAAHSNGFGSHAFSPGPPSSTQSAHTSSNPFGPTSASSNGASGYEGSAFGQHQNGFRSQEFGSQATGAPEFQAGGNFSAEPSPGGALSPASGAPAGFGGLTSPPSRPSAPAPRNPSAAPSMPGTYRKEGGVHDPFADLVGLKPVVKPSVPIRGVGSSSSLSSSGPAAGAQGAAPKPSTTGKASAGGDTFENAFS
ncbi:g10446 [Coccomyxa viridis]|uniref:G10446 protein n=1 Tax=Coccomyxa viridis TaxID=1274662 RepID=A0ABP1GA82_9CHLO